MRQLHESFDYSGAHWPAVMGVLNVTPDSFSDGGHFSDREAALQQARTMVEAGADCLDIGGESTRPGADPVPVQEEIDRVCPVLEAIRSELDIPVSLDTSTPEVMREGARLGATLINDVRALRREGAVEAARDSGLPVCIMHMQGEPATMQQQPSTQMMWSPTCSPFSGTGHGSLSRRVSAGNVSCLTRDSALARRLSII